MKLFQRHQPERKNEDPALVRGDRELEELRERVDRIRTYRKVVTIRVQPKN